MSFLIDVSAIVGMGALIGVPILAIAVAVAGKGMDR